MPGRYPNDVESHQHCLGLDIRLEPFAAVHGDKNATMGKAKLAKSKQAFKIGRFCYLFMTVSMFHTITPMENK